MQADLTDLQFNLDDLDTVYQVPLAGMEVMQPTFINRNQVLFYACFLAIEWYLMF